MHQAMTGLGRGDQTEDVAKVKSVAVRASDQKHPHSPYVSHMCCVVNMDTDARTVLNANKETAVRVMFVSSQKSMKKLVMGPAACEAGNKRCYGF